MLPRFLPLIFIIPLCAHAEHTALEVIPLKYRSVEEVLPVLQPFVGEEGALSGMSGQLIVRTTPARLAQIHKILVKVDTSPKRLRITVRQGKTGEAEKQGAEVSGQVNTGDVRLVVPPEKPREGAVMKADSVHARAWNKASAEQEETRQEIQVMEGKPAWIHIGQALPLREKAVIQQGSTIRIVNSTHYQKIGTGFHVLPRLNGDQVIMEISPQQQGLSAGMPRGYTTQSLNTTVSGRLGEWIELGAMLDVQHGNESGLVYGTSQMASGHGKIWVKVDEQP